MFKWATVPILVMKSMVRSVVDSLERHLNRELSGNLVLPDLVDLEIDSCVKKFKRTISNLDQKELITICIPFYNRFDLARIVIDTLLQAIELENEVLRDFNFEILVMDDCSTKINSTKMKEYANLKGIKYFRNEVNLGVVENENLAFRITEGRVFIILNSDIKIYSGFLSAMIIPLIKDEKIAAVTAPQFEDFVRHLSPGVGAFELAAHLRNEEVVVTCLTNTLVSYAVALDRKKIGGPDLLDVRFSPGYGEDSDLAQRLMKDGFECVYSNSTLVSHLGGSSFQKTSSAPSMGKIKYFNKWRWTYFESAHHFENVKQMMMSLLIAGGVHSPKSNQVYFVLPGVGDHIGGLRVALETMWNSNLQVKVVNLSGDQVNVCDSVKAMSPPDLDIDSISESLFVLFGTESLVWYDSNFRIRDKNMVTYCMQGLDFLINPEDHDLIFRSMRNVDKILYASDYLLSYIQKYNLSNDNYSFRPSLDSVKFSAGPKRVEEKSIDVLILYRNEIGKSPLFAAELANLLTTEHQLNVVAYGSGDPQLLSKKVRYVGRIAPSEAYKLMSNSHIFVDTSLNEGFGLAPREALIKGCQVFLNKHSNLSSLLSSEFAHEYKQYDLLDVINAIIKIRTDIVRNSICVNEFDLEQLESDSNLENLIYKLYLSI
jgi:GT2 family glycosyltransferase